MNTKSKFHNDGTVTYWSVYTQTWRRRYDWITDEDLAALPGKDREKIRKHLKRGTV